MGSKPLSQPLEAPQLASLGSEDDLGLSKLSGDIDEILLDASLGQYQQHLDQISRARVHLDSLLTDTATALDELSRISASFKAIDVQTKAFQKRSAGLVQDYERNNAVAQDVSENLRYYEPLERITRRFNAPGAGNFVRTKDFSDALSTLDECIDYMQTHPGHKEAETYRSRYRLLLTRALTLVRNTFMASVRETTAEVAGRIAERQLNDTTMSALLYAKFRVASAEMKALSLEIQKRASPPADADHLTEGEYQSLMNELHSTFTACRAKLILPIIHKKLGEIRQTPSSADIVQFARASISYVRGTCLDEFELWAEWFHGYRGVDDLLESICDLLYDHLKPRIIHENKLSKLCSLVTLLQTRYLHDEDEDRPVEAAQLDFSVLIQPVLEDAQSRLVFRAQAMLRNEIEYFKPAAEDLAYPPSTSQPPASATVLSGRKSSRTTLDRAAVDDDSADEWLPSWTVTSRRMALVNCYPTLSKAIYLLSRIYRLVNSSVFDDLAHQIVHQTTASLHRASLQIAAKTSPADGQLFLLRHLLLLKSQIVAFDIEYVTPDVAFDFSGVASTFYEIRERGGLFNPRSWMKLFSTGGLLPRVVENMLDAKVELDGRLRTVINELTAGLANDLTKELSKDLAKEGTNTRSPEDAVAMTRKHIEAEIPVLRNRLEQYLDDGRTRETLMAAIEDQVVQIYEAFFDGFIETGAVGQLEGGAQVSRKGKGPENAVWDSNAFAEWAESVFNVMLPETDHDGTSQPPSRSLSESGSR